MPLPGSALPCSAAPKRQRKPKAAQEDEDDDEDEEVEAELEEDDEEFKQGKKRARKPPAKRQ